MMTNPLAPGYYVLPVGSVRVLCTSGMDASCVDPKALRREDIEYVILVRRGAAGTAIRATLADLATTPEAA
jgi:hypothetical protein